MFCINCRAELSDGAKFCTSCGTPQPVAAAKPAPQPEPVAEPVPAPQPVPAATPEPAPAPQPVPAATPEPAPAPQPVPEIQPAAPAPPKKKKGRGIIIALVIILVLALVGGGLFLLYRGGVFDGLFDKGPSIEAAEEYIKNENYALAIQEYEALITADEANADAYLGLAEAHLANGDDKKAIKTLKDALKAVGDEKDIDAIQELLDELTEDETEPPATTIASSTTVTEPVIETIEAIETIEPEPMQLDMQTIGGTWYADILVSAGMDLEPSLCSIEITESGTEYTLTIHYNGQYTRYEAIPTGGYSFSCKNNENSITLSYFDNYEQLEMLATANSGKSCYGAFSRRTAASGSGSDTALGTEVRDDGRVLNIWCWNEELKDRMIQFYPDYVENYDGTGRIGNVTVKWTINPAADYGYQIPLDANLLDQDNKAADEKIDIFLVEPDYASKYINSPYVLPVSAVGITDADTAEMYRYTKQIATNDNGELMGVSWLACPGAFAYRRSMAMEVLGTDDPAVVQQFVSDWDKFDETAKKMKAAGYCMLSGYDDAFRVFSQNTSQPWVNENREIIIDENLLRWVEQTKSYTENGFNNKHDLWSGGWADDQSPDGKVFGFFYSTWGVNFTLPFNAEYNSDWAVCCGPQAYQWGASWICAAYQTDNRSLVRDIMYNMACNADIMRSMTLDENSQDFTNNMAAMNSIASDPSYGSEFLGGQNHAAIFHESAQKIDLPHITPYDASLNEIFQWSFDGYFDGIIDYDTALNNFYNNAIVKHPELIKPE